MVFGLRRWADGAAQRPTPKAKHPLPTRRLTMTTEATILTAEFPRAVRGYATNAVDDFVRQMGERIDTLQVRLEQQAARANHLTKELETANRNLAVFMGK